MEKIVLNLTEGTLKECITLSVKEYIILNNMLEYFVAKHGGDYNVMKLFEDAIEDKWEWDEIDSLRNIMDVLRCKFGEVN